MILMLTNSLLLGEIHTPYCFVEQVSCVCMTVMFSVKCIAFYLWVFKVLSYVMFILMFGCYVHIKVSNTSKGMPSL